MRRHGKVDAHHVAIVEALRAAGASVLSLASLGNGAPDLLVARNGKHYLLEVKSPKKEPNADQQKWMGQWKAPVYVVRSVAEAFNVVVR